MWEICRFRWKEPWAHSHQICPHISGNWCWLYWDAQDNPLLQWPTESHSCPLIAEVWKNEFPGHPVGRCEASFQNKRKYLFERMLQWKGTAENDFTALLTGFPRKLDKRSPIIEGPLDHSACQQLFLALQDFSLFDFLVLAKGEMSFLCSRDAKHPCFVSTCLERAVEFHWKQSLTSLQSAVSQRWVVSPGKSL